MIHDCDVFEKVAAKTKKVAAKLEQVDSKSVKFAVKRDKVGESETDLLTNKYK